MLVDHIEHAFVGTICAIENFAFSVEDKFLQVKRYRFSNAEVLGILRNAYFHFFTYPEKMINGVPAGEDHSGVLADLNLLFTEFFRRDSLQANKRVKIHLYIELPGKFVVR